MYARLYVAPLAPRTVATCGAFTGNDAPPAVTCADPENTVIVVVAPSGLTSTRYSPAAPRPIAAFGASISSVSPDASACTCRIADPCGTLTWIAASSSRSMLTCVCDPRRSSAEPISTSARVMLSDHKASPVVTGRFGTAGAHAESPAARNDRLPEMRANRPTRAGGSSAGAGSTSGEGACTTCVTQEMLVPAI